MESQVCRKGLRMLSGAAEAALDLIYPDSLYCICCGKIIDETRQYRLCNECMRGMKWAVGRVCAECGKPLAENYAFERCYSCREHVHRFERGYTCAEYGMQERGLTQALKFGDRTDIAGTIAEMMHDRLELARAEGETCAYDAVIPVPMHPEKLRRRGYNQASLIAKKLARLEDIDYCGGVVIRVRETSAMKGLSADERRLNVSGAFEISERRSGLAAGKRLLVVDDIYTTGATADEVAGVLYSAGAGRVDVITFAAGANIRVSCHNNDSCK